MAVLGTGTLSRSEGWRNMIFITPRKADRHDLSFICLGLLCCPTWYLFLFFPGVMCFQGRIFAFPEYSVSTWWPIRTQQTHSFSLELSRVPEPPKVPRQCRVYLQYGLREVAPWRFLCDSALPTGRRGLLGQPAPCTCPGYPAF